MSSCRGMPSSCAQIRGWTLSWLTDWCCSWTGSTPRYSVTRKLTGSQQITYGTNNNNINKNPLSDKYSTGVCAWIQINMCVSAVQEAECAHQGPVSWAAEALARKRWGGVPWILQRASHPRWGRLRQPAQQSQRKRHEGSISSLFCSLDVQKCTCLRCILVSVETKWNRKRQTADFIYITLPFNDNKYILLNKKWVISRRWALVTLFCYVCIITSVY